MHDLMEKASNDKTKVIFIGDKKQYQAVEAGSPFRKLSETFGSERLESFIRQRDNKELHDTVKEAYEGNISLEKISKNIFEKSTKKARLEQTIDLFFKTKDLTNSLVVTETNVDKDKLNMKIREKLIERGLLSHKKIVISSNIPNQDQSFDKKEIELREGDKIEWRKNSINMKNREIAYVETISKRSITLKKKDGTTFKINPKKENFLDHGWASTTYSSQGMTVNNVIALMDQKTSKQGYYVAVSRAEKSYAIVTDDKNRLQKEVNKDLIKLNAMDFVKNEKARTY
jgi:ATP-dependent exoDNAse (exonuclease V) alpha subunit